MSPPVFVVELLGNCLTDFYDVFDVGIFGRYE